MGVSAALRTDDLINIPLYYTTYRFWLMMNFLLIIIFCLGLSNFIPRLLRKCLGMRWRIIKKLFYINSGVLYIVRLLHVIKNDPFLTIHQTLANVSLICKVRIMMTTLGRMADVVERRVMLRQHGCSSWEETWTSWTASTDRRSTTCWKPGLCLHPKYFCSAL